MNATTIHIKTDMQARNAAKKVAEDFGLTLTSLVNALLKQIARDKLVTLDLDETPNGGPHGASNVSIAFQNRVGEKIGIDFAKTVARSPWTYSATQELAQVREEIGEQQGDVKLLIIAPVPGAHG